MEKNKHEFQSLLHQNLNSGVTQWKKVIHKPSVKGLKTKCKVKAYIITIRADLKLKRNSRTAIQ